MPSQQEAAEWIMKVIFDDAYDAAGCMAVSQLHQLVFHEKELEEAGIINSAQSFKAARATISDNFDPEFLEKIKSAHDALPEHRYLP